MNAKNAKQAVALIILTVMIMLAGWMSYEYYTLKRPLMEVHQENKQFSKLAAEAKYAGFMNNRAVVFNLIKVSNPGTLTPFEYFVKFAAKMQDRRFDKVLIQYKGETKYIVDGLAFSGLGMKSQLMKIEQIAIEFPPYLRTTNGMPAFEKPFGDEQWVAQKDMKNFRDFLFNWYINDWIAEVKNDQDKKVMSTGSPESGENESPSAPVEIPDIDVEASPKPSKN